MSGFSTFESYHSEMYQLLPFKYFFIAFNYMYVLAAVEEALRAST